MTFDAKAFRDGMLQAIGFSLCGVESMRCATLCTACHRDAAFALAVLSAVARQHGVKDDLVRVRGWFRLIQEAHLDILLAPADADLALRVVAAISALEE